MKRYWTMAGVLLIFFLISFLLVEALGVPILTDPLPWMKHGGSLAALVGVALLVADAVAPVPSSPIMIAHGALFGVFGGTLLSLVGSGGATLLGFSLGRRGGLLLEWLVPPRERARADRLLSQWGALAIVITRPVPLLAEAVAILAGASPLGWGRAALAALSGSLPGALLYALTGAVAASFKNGMLIFGLVLVVAGSFWLIGSGVGASLTVGKPTRDSRHS
jgi:uncharacterized membrane protein YdjX (TVP38/TMEM64 family)